MRFFAAAGASSSSASASSATRTLPATAVETTLTCRPSLPACCRARVEPTEDRGDDRQRRARQIADDAAPGVKHRQVHVDLRPRAEREHPARGEERAEERLQRRFDLPPLGPDGLPRRRARRRRPSPPRARLPAIVAPSAPTPLNVSQCSPVTTAAATSPPTMSPMTIPRTSRFSMRSPAWPCGARASTSQTRRLHEFAWRGACAARRADLRRGAIVSGARVANEHDEPLSARHGRYVEQVA